MSSTEFYWEPWELAGEPKPNYHGARMTGLGV